MFNSTSSKIRQQAEQAGGNLLSKAFSKEWLQVSKPKKFFTKDLNNRKTVRYAPPGFDDPAFPGSDDIVFSDDDSAFPGFDHSAFSAKIQKY